MATPLIYVPLRYRIRASPLAPNTPAILPQFAVVLRYRNRSSAVGGGNRILGIFQFSSIFNSPVISSTRPEDSDL